MTYRQIETYLSKAMEKFSLDKKGWTREVIELLFMITHSGDVGTHKTTGTSCQVVVNFPLKLINFS